jgi:predicted O-methyltransferase YrrM
MGLRQLVPAPARRLARSIISAATPTAPALPDWTRDTFPAPAAVEPPANHLRSFFEARTEGRGIWKWQHYFDIYNRYFAKFRGRSPHVLEIGVYSGGSLDMWRDYFGAGAHIYGVDIEPACRAYETADTRVFIGDQANRSFWRGLGTEGLALDVVIDDGGHKPQQQIASFEELLPLIRPGGVYLCEDVHMEGNEFSRYAHGITDKLNAMQGFQADYENPNRRIACSATPLQFAIGSIHFYPFVVVVERNGAEVSEFVAPKRGTEWQPHL